MGSLSHTTTKINSFYSLRSQTGDEGGAMEARGWEMRTKGNGMIELQQGWSKRAMKEIP